MLVEARLADPGTAAGTRSEAPAAAAVVTHGTGRQAAGAVRVSTTGAVHIALVTDVRAALLADEPLVFIDHSTAVAACAAVPGGQFHEWALRVVGPQHMGHECEKVQQPALGQRLADGLPAMPFAQNLIQHMRMGHVVAGGGRVGLEGHDAVTGLGGQVFPVEPDLKRAEQHIFEFDRLGNHRQRAGPEVGADLLELRLECHDVAVNVADRVERRGLRRGIQPVRETLEFHLQRAERTTQVVAELLGRQSPATEFGPANIADERFAAAPTFGRQLGHPHGLPTGLQLGMHRDGQSHEWCLGMRHGKAFPSC